MPSDDQPTAGPLVLADGLSREALLAQVGNAARSAAGPLHLVGHGSSGVAVLSLAIHQRRLGFDLAHVTCMDARGGPDPVSGQALVFTVRPAKVTTRITLFPDDDDASISWTDRTAAALRAARWDVTT